MSHPQQHQQQQQPQSQSRGARASLEPPAIGDCDARLRQRLIAFAHTQWGFKNWNWAVVKQELDFVDFPDEKYSAGVASYVSIVVNSLGLTRENVGYASTMATDKGTAIHNARKESVTNALCETLLAFGGTVAAQLLERLESLKSEEQADKKNGSDKSADQGDNANANANSASQPKNRKDSSDSSLSNDNSAKGVRSPQRYGNNQQHSNGKSLDKAPSVSNYPANHSVVKPTCFNNNNSNHNKVAPPLPSAVVPGNVRSNAQQQPPPPPPPHHPQQQQQRPSSSVSYLVQHMMPPTAFYELPPWPIYDHHLLHHHHHHKVGAPPRNFHHQGGVARSPPPQGGGSSSGGPAGNYVHAGGGAWIKPTIFYDGFWTEQKVQKWVAEQMDKSPPPAASDDDVTSQQQMCHSKV